MVYPISISNIPRVVRDAQEPPGEWKVYTLSFDIDKHIDVNVIVYNDVVYMKPYRQYFTAEFEKMFNFGIGCVNYDENKTIVVTQPSDYSSNFKS